MCKGTEQNQLLVSLTKNDPLALIVGFCVGCLLILGLLIIGSSLVPEHIRCYDRDIAVPIGIISVALLAMWGFERKPQKELQFLTFSTIVAILAGVADSGVDPASFEAIIDAILICSPGLSYLATRQALDICRGK